MDEIKIKEKKAWVTPSLIVLGFYLPNGKDIQNPSESGPGPDYGPS
jgi:hypothetical protein